MKTTLLQGDCRDVLPTLPEKHFHCAITSPPYWGLRRYLKPGHPLADKEIGQEKTPDLYVETMVQVFRELWRVLRDDATLWLNLGDSYANDTKWGGSSGGKHVTELHGDTGIGRGKKNTGLKSKDLIGIPWRVAFALQASGWYLRSDIIWAKPNCMPESVTDRPTRSHEYIFLLTKKPTYFYDAEAIREAGSMTSVEREQRARGPYKYATGEHGQLPQAGTAFKPRPNRSNKQRGHSRKHDGFNARWDAMSKEEQCAGTRNKRDVWFISPASYRDAHFATFPVELIKPCILAGTSEGGCCVSCGSPRLRIVEKGDPDTEQQRACGGDANGEYNGQATKDFDGSGVQNASDLKRRVLAGMTKRKTSGWQPSCKCEAATVPCRVIDPFAGSGTVGEVSLGYAREFTGIDLNTEYLPMQKKRTSQPALL